MTEAEVSKKIIDEVYSAREKIHEETKHMTASEYVAYFSNRAQAIITRNGYTAVHSKDGPWYTIEKLNG